MSDLQRRTEALLRSRGYLTGSVERRKRFPAPKSQPCKACGLSQMIDIAHDLWNVFDLVAVRPKIQEYINTEPASSVVFVQVTSFNNHADRRNKIIASSEARLCLLSGVQILIQSWGKKDNRWVAKDEWITIDQFVQGLPDTVEQFYEDERRQKLLDRKSKLPALPPGTTLPLSPYLQDDEMPF
jgi:hypothetical protein